ncbi:terminase small subunit [Niabella sp. CJ426]|uniref:terminase small subunit n=1 Tax=Niabella sp. CJ426 TaxID=3393740 RepID=UPI003CFEAEE6
MAAPKGNQYYLIAESTGRPLEYTPEELRLKFNEYAIWVNSNPFQEVDYKNGKRVKLPKMRPFTLKGFCIFAGIVVNTFKGYEERKDFLTVTAMIRQIIENQQFEGAAAGFLKENIISYELGQKGKLDITTNGKDLPVPIIQVAPNDFTFATREEDVS